MKSARLVALCLLLLASLSARAGVVIEFVNRNLTTGTDELARTMSIQGGMARIESFGAHSPAGPSIVIFKDGALHVLDASTKSYLVFDKAAIERASAAMSEMKRRFANLPPDQRALLEQAMRQNGGSLENFGISNPAQKPTVYDAAATGGGDTINGIKCKLWNVTRDGAQIQQLCVASIGSLPGGIEVVSVLKKISALMNELGEQTLARMGADMPSNAVQAKIKGYPLASRAFRDGKPSTDEFIVKSWRQNVSVEPEKFAIPPGYTKQELPQFGPGN